MTDFEPGRIGACQTVTASKRESKQNKSARSGHPGSGQIIYS
jgi:hypothetical protein